eukprot:gnl/TRDRNA2_/TRDRNA2_33140_c0_seq1.p1 gnl/TRDRNA2_/TRDRNA2_33140_c0~~gnl/TRDRNA2_/TRDRNA2_33140_c0_seq1.p1  ORF type:complete len:325 (+),score=30.51 gnl/TRDRNA2_/TRDRNA2_33140_c0_seq1:102-977(+)
MLAPVPAGLLMSFLSPESAASLIAAVNVFAWPVEWACLGAVHRDPWCRVRLESIARATVGSTTGSAESVPQAADGRGAWHLYFAQTIWPSAFALSMLHMTVLCSDGPVMTAYFKTLGVSPAVITAYRCVGELFGLAATRLSPILVRHMGAARAATPFIWAQWTMLVLAVVGVSPWAGTWPHLLPATLLVGSVGVSRLGLWGFDLSVSQLLQEQVSPTSSLAAVNGVQKSLEAFFGASASVATILLHDPSQFFLLSLGSFASVTSAGILHTAAQHHDHRKRKASGKASAKVL